MAKRHANVVVMKPTPVEARKAPELTAKDLARLKARLIEHREEVMDDLRNEQEVLRSAAAAGQGHGWDLDFAGEASDTGSTEQAAMQVRRLTAVLEQVSAALSRIEAGTYGICTRCRLGIEKERLEAIPFTRRCVQCKMASEAA
jgi:RNA polymerase-binding transcription factor DksA